MDFSNPPALIVDNQLNTKQAILYQKEWSTLLQTEDGLNQVTTVAGADLAYDYASNRAFAVVALLDAQTLEVLEVQKACTAIEVPYRSGFLSFREVPSLRQAFEQLKQKPDLIVCDGQGIAHPRRFGLACHLGLIYDLPTIGCGKTRLYGFAEMPGENRGAYSYLYDKQQAIIGCVLRTRPGVKPVYISVGHKISLETAREWILQLTPKYRLPETTRWADRLAHEYKIAHCSMKQSP